MWRLPGVLVALLAAGSAAGLNSSSSPSSASVEEVVRRIQTHLDGVRDFEARFTQRYYRQIIGKVLIESGVVAIKKPGRMRWDYTSPEQKLFITDGEKTYFYLPEEKQVIVSHTSSGALGLTPDSPLTLLAGRSRLVDAFEVYPSPSEPKVGGTVLRLVPRRPQADFDEIEIEADNDGRVRRVVLVDSQDNRTDFLFDDIKENQNLPEMLFVFTIPSGVDIILAEDSGADSPSPEPKKP